MRVRLSVFYPLTERQLKEAQLSLSQKLVKKKLEVVVECRPPVDETKVIVCSFEEHSMAFAGSALARELFQTRVKTEVSQWAGRGVRVLVSGMRNRPVRQKRLAAA